MALGWLGWRAWVSGVTVGAAPFCVAGVALGDMDHYFVRLTYNSRTHNLSAPNLTWTFTLRCRRGRSSTWRHGPLLCVASVALDDMDPHFACQAHTHTIGFVTQLQIDAYFAWQAWHLATWTFPLRGRRGTW